MGISLREELMSRETYEAAVEGNVEIFEETESDIIDEYLLRKTFELNNIMHLAFRSTPYDPTETLLSNRDKATFVLKALSRFPHLLRERNLDGDTPLHLAAAELQGNDDIVREIYENLPDVSPLLRMRNSVGNTPLHVALIRNQPQVALIMLEKDPSLATILNNSLEAPLHLAIKYFPDFFDKYNPFDPVVQMNLMEQKKLDLIDIMREKETWWYYYVEKEEYEKERFEGGEENKEFKVIMVLLEKAGYVAGWKDANGMTPLHLAASLDKAFNLVFISYIIHCCPPSMEVCDSSGKTILHHLIHRILYPSEAEDCLYEPRLRLLRDHQDHDGNTPAHLAVINKDFIMIQLSLSDNWKIKASHLKNKAGQSVVNLIEQGELLTGKITSSVSSES